MCVFGKSVAYFIRLAAYSLCVIGRLVAHLIRFADLCYENVSCSFDSVSCLCVMGMPVAYLILFAACMLLESQLLI